MNRRPKWNFSYLTLLALGTILLVSAACGGQVTSNGSTNNSNVLQALAFAPAGVTDFTFTDWSLITDYEGIPNVTSKSSDSDRTRFLSSLTQGQAAASSFGLSDILTQEAVETWSFDPRDFSWDATLYARSLLDATVVKFHADFDLTPVIAHFRDRGYDQSVYRDFTIYSHKVDIGADWFGTLDNTIFNVAELASQKILIFGGSLDSLHAVIDAYKGATPSLTSNAATHSLAQSLGSLFSVEIVSSATTCAELDSLPIEKQTILQSDLSGLNDLHAYTWLGVGYRYEQRHLTGLIALNFPSMKDATSDLGQRRKLAASGTSLVSNHPYSSEIFTVDNAGVHNDNLTLNVSPVGGEPIHLFDMMLYDDLAFAACPT
ncbi:MAG TPA: hypothetical protein VH591_01845 [Ktedonobacterales bacterium]|jgi:hypothetical protein